MILNKKLASGLGLLLLLLPANAAYNTAVVVPPITALGAKCDGATDDSVAIAASLTKYGVAVAPNLGTLCYVNPGSHNGVSVGAGQTVTAIGAGGYKIGALQTQGFYLTGNRATLRGATIDCNGALYCVRGANVDGATVDSNRFSGNATLVVFMGCDDNGGLGKNSAVTNNVFNGTGYLIGAAIKWEGCAGAKATGNQILNVGGAGSTPFISWFSSGLIQGNNFYSPDVGSTVTATAAQTVFNFTASETGGFRFALHVNGTPTYIDGATWVKSGTDPNWVITGPAQSAGTTVRLVVSRTAEAINLEAASGMLGRRGPSVPDGTGVVISGNTINGSGDGGIDISCDLIWVGATWVVSPGCVSGTVLDLPGNITITGNSIYNTFVSPIFSIFGQRGVTIQDNILGAPLQNAGPSNPQDSSFISMTYSGLVSADSQVRIGYNILDNSIGTATYGIAISGQDAPDLGMVSKSIEIAQQNWVGTPVPVPYFFQGTHTQLDSGINLTSSPMLPWPQQPDLDTAWGGALPTADNYWNYGELTAVVPGSIQGTVPRQGGTHSTRTVCGGGMTLIALSETESPNSGYAYGNVVHFKVSAISDTTVGTSSTSSYIQIVGDTGAGAFRPESQKVYLNRSATSWSNYDVSAAIQGTDRFIYGVVAAPVGTCVRAYWQQPTFWVQQVDAQ